MGVLKRGGTYHYRFMHESVIYSGNTGETDERAAKKFEADLKRGIVKLHAVKMTYDRFRQEVLGADSIKLCEAWGRFMAKPGRRQTPKTDEHKSQWDDFAGYIADNFPAIDTLDKVTAFHAEEYVSHTERDGRWKKRTAASGGKLATSTLNEIRSTCRRVFASLLNEAGMSRNPFAGIQQMKNLPTDREAFTPEELRIIGDRSMAVPWIRHIFLVGIYTGLREGDICTMKWIDIDDGWVQMRMRKTGKAVEVPILPALRDYLNGLPREGEYVFPELAERYSDPARRGNIGKDIGKFLTEKCGIQTTRQVAGRSRAAVVKDVHSLRHTFCYMATLAGIPLPVVQGIVGHMSPEMTKRYMNHAGRDAKRLHLEKLPDLLAG